MSQHGGEKHAEPFSDLSDFLLVSSTLLLSSASTTTSWLFHCVSKRKSKPESCSSAAFLYAVAQRRSLSDCYPARGTGNKSRKDPQRYVLCFPSLLPPLTVPHSQRRAIICLSGEPRRWQPNAWPLLMFSLGGRFCRPFLLHPSTPATATRDPDSSPHPPVCFLWME